MARPAQKSATAKRPRRRASRSAATPKSVATPDKKLKVAARSTKAATPGKAVAKPTKAVAKPTKAVAKPTKAAQLASTRGKAKTAKATAKPRATRARRPIQVDAAPIPIEITDTQAARLSLTARERVTRSSPVVEILDDDHPIGALRRFLDGIKGEATPQQAQIALGAAQLMLLPKMGEPEHRGTADVTELVDLVLHHWEDFGERRRGFHAQEFLRNALNAIGVDRDRIARLEALIPENGSSELLFNLACAHAVARDKVAMLAAVERALEAGATSPEFRRDPDFAPYANDPDLAILLARAEIPQIPVDIEPYLPGVREALDSLLSTLKEYGESVELRPGVRLDAILDAERAGRVSLPNDYRALLTLTNGMRLWEHEFFATGDYREPTRLAVRAQQYLQTNLGTTGIAECVPLASWGQPRDWLLYDPRGRLRGGEAGYVLVLGAAEQPLHDLADALAQMENLAREVLGTN